MESTGHERRLAGPTGADGLLPCCESWLAEQLLGEAARRGRDGPRPPVAAAPPVWRQDERPAPAELPSDSGIV
jgi:hypothetical protein